MCLKVLSRVGHKRDIPLGSNCCFHVLSCTLALRISMTTPPVIWSFESRDFPVPPSRPQKCKSRRAHLVGLSEEGGDPPTCPDSIDRFSSVETPHLRSVMSATCTCHRQVFLPHKGVASCWSRSWPAPSFPPSSSSPSSPHVLLLSRGLGGEELDPLGFFHTRELTNPEILIYFPAPIILFWSQI